MLDQGFQDLSDLEGQFFTGVGDILTRVEADMEEGECELQGVILSWPSITSDRL